MPPTSLTAATTLGLALGLTGAGCTSTGPQDARSSGATSSTQEETPQPTSKTTQPTQPTQEDGLAITFTTGGTPFHATLDDSAAARDLLAMLPVTIDMADHGGVEKTGPLPGPLSLDGQPDGADPAVGDVGYYAPGNDLVLYHGDQGYHPGIVVLGRLEETAAERVAAMAGSVTVTVEAQR